jgi:hypothetical protein
MKMTEKQAAQIVYEMFLEQFRAPKGQDVASTDEFVEALKFLGGNDSKKTKALRQLAKNLTDGDKRDQ